jgi:hypothetical protein
MKIPRASPRWGGVVVGGRMDLLTSISFSWDIGIGRCLLQRIHTRFTNTNDEHDVYIFP